MTRQRLVGGSVMNIFTERIDAAWASATEPNQDRDRASAKMRALDLLGIVKCFGCNGWGRMVDEDGNEISVCLVCGGHRWLIENAP